MTNEDTENDFFSLLWLLSLYFTHYNNIIGSFETRSKVQKDKTSNDTEMKAARCR